MIKKLVRSGNSLPRMKPPLSGAYSSSRWIVFASCPDASFKRFAARPVGAASAGLIPADASATSSERNSVVLPVPGPPVITVTRLASAHLSALFCSVESSSSDDLIAAASARSIASLPIARPEFNSAIRFATLTSASCNRAR